MPTHLQQSGRLAPAVFAWAVCIMFIAMPVLADVVYDTSETWTNGLQGWTNYTSFGLELSNPGGVDGYLSMHWDEEAGEPPGDFDRIFTYGAPATNHFVGNYTNTGHPSGYPIYGPLGTPEDLLYDLGSVDWIGLYIQRNGLGAQDYRIDNFMLFVPEPGGMALLAAALVSIGATLRRKRRSDLSRTD